MPHPRLVGTGPDTLVAQPGWQPVGLYGGFGISQTGVTGRGVKLKKPVAGAARGTGNDIAGAEKYYGVALPC